MGFLQGHLAFMQECMRSNELKDSLWHCLLCCLWPATNVCKQHSWVDLTATISKVIDSKHKSMQSSGAAAAASRDCASMQPGRCTLQFMKSLVPSDIDSCWWGALLMKLVVKVYNAVFQYPYLVRSMLYVSVLLQEQLNSQGRRRCCCPASDGAHAPCPPLLMKMMYALMPSQLLVTLKMATWSQLKKRKS